VRARPRRVLLVEADPALRGRLIDRLDEADMRVRTATAPGCVRAALAEGWPELVVIGSASRRHRAVVSAICFTECVPVVVLGDAGRALAEVVRAVG